MFEKEAKRSFDELDDRGIGDDWSIEEAEQFLKENKYDRQRKTGRKI